MFHLDDTCLDGLDVAARRGTFACGVDEGAFVAVVGAGESEGAEDRLAGMSASKVGLDKDEHRWQLTNSYKRLSRVGGHRNGLSSFGRSVQWSRKGKGKGQHRSPRSLLRPGLC
jgi:hypothetical protein